MILLQAGADRSALRRQLRARRAGIDPRDRAIAARRAAGHLMRMIELRHAGHLAVYLAAGSELDTRPLIRALHRRGKRLCAPQIDVRQPGHMRMQQLFHGKPLRRNHYGIPEPPPTRRRHRTPIEVVIVPLVGIDLQGNRLGSGAGYYDRWLARLRPRPYRIGYAFSVQKVDHLPAQDWDVPLDAVCSEAGVHRFKNRRRRKGERVCLTG
ncbi:MAG: 5-formyltetrahydrofolate cyclo-ligase [Panacagrimonas sp.]